MSNPEHYATSLIPTLDAVDASPEATELRAHTYRLLGPQPGDLVVDAGCGPGRAVGELHERGARAVGVDINEYMIEIARERWPEAEFHRATAEELPFDTGTVTGYRADKVLHTLDKPGVALAEAHRVLAPGGRIVLVGQDWDTVIIDSDDGELTRRVVLGRADTIASPRAARAHRNLLLDAGFRDPTVEVHTTALTGSGMLGLIRNIAGDTVASGAITQDEADRWTAEQTRRAEAGRFFLAIPMFLAAARR